MSASFYFYDLETSGINSRTSRIMQFAGQRTDLNLRPVEEPDNILIKLTNDILPEPEAIMVTGITPQATLADGVTEYEFLRYFTDKIATPDTIFVGYNNVRFDDEFIRFIHYRNFYDAYEWCWQDNRSRWDILDVIRMTRALRPDGIEWPYTIDGKPTNRLELLTSVNKLEHSHAHDALSDVNATITVARLIMNKQPKLFDYLLKIRNKNEVKKLVETSQPFVYSSGRYPSGYQKTTVAVYLGSHAGKQGSLVYDLRRDPDEVANLSPEELAKIWYQKTDDEAKRFPVKTITYNKCPAVAPLSVLESDKKAQENIKIDLNKTAENLEKLSKYNDFYNKLCKALKILEKQSQTSFLASSSQVDSQLYDGFFSDQDKVAMSVVRAAEPDEVSSLDMKFQDPRLNELLPLYKARNFSKYLDQSEIEAWEKHRVNFLLSGGNNSRMSKYFARLNELAQDEKLSSENRYLLEELQLYGQSIMPEEY